MNTKIKSYLKKHSHVISLAGIFSFGILIFSIFTTLNHRLDGTDDVIFQVQTLPYNNVIEWVVYRYHEWSGRIFSEAFVYLFASLPFFLWQLTSIFMYSVFSVVLFFFYKLFTSTPSESKDYIMAIAALGLPFLMQFSVINGGLIWMTGSMVYMWTTTLTLVAIYPIFFYVKRNYFPNLFLILVGVIAGIVAASSQEQVGAVLIGISTVLLSYSLLVWIKKRNTNFPWYPVLIVLLNLAAFLFSILAPGNEVRVKLEVIRWLPDFYTTPQLERLTYSYRWLIEALINHSGYLIAFIWVLLAGLLLKKSNPSLFDKRVASVLILLAILISSRGIESLNFMFEFYATWKQQITNKIVSVNVIGWGIILVTTAFVPLLVFKKKSLAYFLVILFAAAIASTAIITLSPTLYASGWRSMFVPSVLLMTIAYILLDKAIDAYFKQSYIFAVVIVGLALTQYAHQSAQLIKSIL